MSCIAWTVQELWSKFLDLEIWKPAYKMVPAAFNGQKRPPRILDQSILVKIRQPWYRQKCSRKLIYENLISSTELAVVSFGWWRIGCDININIFVHTFQTICYLIITAYINIFTGSYHSFWHSLFRPPVLEKLFTFSWSLHLTLPIFFHLSISIFVSVSATSPIPCEVLNLRIHVIVSNAIGFSFSSL